MLMVDDVTALIKRVTLTSSVLDLDYSECLMTLYTERFVGSDEVKGFKKTHAKGCRQIYRRCRSIQSSDLPIVTC